MRMIGEKRYIRVTTEFDLAVKKRLNIKEDLNAFEIRRKYGNRETPYSLSEALKRFFLQNVVGQILLWVLYIGAFLSTNSVSREKYVSAVFFGILAGISFVYTIYFLIKNRGDDADVGFFVALFHYFLILFGGVFVWIFRRNRYIKSYQESDVDRAFWEEFQKYWKTKQSLPNIVVFKDCCKPIHPQFYTVQSRYAYDKELLSKKNKELDGLAEKEMRKIVQRGDSCVLIGTFSSNILRPTQEDIGENGYITGHILLVPEANHFYSAYLEVCFETLKNTPWSGAEGYLKLSGSPIRLTDQSLSHYMSISPVGAWWHFNE